MIEQWKELKETIIEMRDNDGTGTQKEVCKFLANLMDILELKKQMVEPKESEDIEALEQTRWTPVSEGLPKGNGEYLLFGKICEDDENCIFIGDYDSDYEQFGIGKEQYDRHTLGCLGSEFYEYENVVAWTPLPEPYEEV